jgi:hypothetical protein
MGVCEGQDFPMDNRLEELIFAGRKAFQKARLELNYYRDEPHEAKGRHSLLCGH